MHYFCGYYSIQLDLYAENTEIVFFLTMKNTEIVNRACLLSIMGQEPLWLSQSYGLIYTSKTFYIMGMHAFKEN